MPDKTKAHTAAQREDICNSICRLPNKENNCWLNATLQSILHLQVVQHILKELTATLMVQMSSMPENLAAFIQAIFLNPGHTFQTSTIQGVTQELVKRIPALDLGKQNDPMDLIHKLLEWLDICSVRTTTRVKHTDTCTKCQLEVERISDMANIFVLALNNDIKTTFEHSIMEGPGPQSCTDCGSVVMKRQTCWITHPDFLTIFVNRVVRVNDDDMVVHKPVVPSDTIEIPICDSSNIKYKLGSII